MTRSVPRCRSRLRARLERGAALLGLLLAVPAPALELRVEDPAGKPVAGAVVEVFAGPRTGELAERLMPALVRAETDADGRLPELLPDLASLLVTIDHPAWSLFEAEVSGERLREPVRLSPGRTLAGLVAPRTVGSARLCARWTSRAADWAPARERERCTTTDATRRFHLPGLPAAEDVMLHVSAPGFLPKVEPLATAKTRTLTLESGILLEGRVQSAGGGLLAGAGVEVDEIHRTTTDENGRFRLTVVRFPLRLTVAAPGHRAEALEIPRMPAETLLVTLGPRERIVATVLGEEAEPLPEVRIVLDELVEEGRFRGHEETLATTEGRIAIDLPGPGRYRLRLRAEGYRLWRKPPFAVAPGETVDLGVVRLRRGAGFTGWVIDGRTKEPLAGVDLLAVPAGTGLLDALRERHLMRTTTDDEGFFLLAGLPPGGYELRISRRGYAEASLRDRIERDTLHPVGSISLHRGIAVTGRIVDSEGHGRVGLTLQVFDSGRTSLLPIASLVTGSEGSFGPVLLSPGSYRVEVRRDRLLLAQTVRAGDEPDNVWNLTLQGVHVRGLLTRGGQPIPGGLLRLAAGNDPNDQRGKFLLANPEAGVGAVAYGLPDGAFDVPVDNEGRFEVEDVPAGLVYWRYFGPLSPGTGGDHQLLLPEDPTIFLELDLTGFELSGHVVEAGNGAAIPHATVGLFDDRGRQVGRVVSDADGAFVFADLGPGHYRLDARTAGFSGAPVEVELCDDRNTAPVEVVLAPATEGRIDVTLRYPSGDPAAGALVSLFDATGRMVRALAVDSEGRREFRDLPAGDYALVWTDGLAGTGGLGPFRLHEEKPLELAPVLATGAPVRLFCPTSECAGAAVEDLRLTTTTGVPLTAQLPAMAVGLRLSDKGWLELGTLSPGNYRLRFRAGGRSWEREITVGSWDQVLRLE